MNINMLKDQDDDAGFYAAVTSPDPKWPGCVLFQSVDDGATYQQVIPIVAAATMGRALNVLGDFNGGNTVDESNILKVALTQGELSSVPYSSFINGVQAAIIGDEIVYFRDAVLNADNTYTMSGFLRGRRGSEYAIGGHLVGERFIFIDTSLRRIQGATADLHMPRLYKAATVGTSLAAATPSSFTNDGAGLKPYAPVQVGGGRDGAGNLTINWMRRSRISGEWRNFADVPLGETSEAYQVDVMNVDLVVRTLTSTTPTVTYTVEDQIADFGSAQSAVSIRVVQMSDIVGRGYPASATI